MFDWFKDWRESRSYGGQTGLNEMRNSAKMAGILAGPFLGGWLLVIIFFPLEFIEVGIIGVFIGWLAYCVLVYAYAKADASSFRAFPQSTWRFPDGGVRVFNMLVPPDGFQKVCEFEDGDLGYRVSFSDRFQYWMDGVSFPYVWGGAFLKVPDFWDKSFAFRSAGEFFHKGIAVDHPACENGVSFYVVDWYRDPDGNVIPIAFVNDCALTYDEFIERGLKAGEDQLGEVQAYKMLVENARHVIMEMSGHDKLLEDTVTVMEERAVDVGKITKRILEKAREQEKDILTTDEPLLKRILNWGNLFKTILVVVLILAIMVVFFGFPWGMI